MSYRRSSRHTSVVAQFKRLETEKLPLYGRDQELLLLKNALASKSESFVGVTGYSGVGKTALIKEFAAASKDDAWFLSGKFDQQMSSKPYSAISMALRSLVIECDFQLDASFDKEQLALVQGVEPYLKKYFDGIIERKVEDELERSSDDFHSAAYASERIRDALISFFCKVSEDQNIVICLNDMQWADRASLEMIEMLVKAIQSKKSTESISPDDLNEQESATSSKLMVLVDWRSNELERTPELQQLLSKCSPLVIEIGVLTVASLNQCISHLLGLRNQEDKRVLELTKVIHRKTEGNVFFALQVMTWLHSKTLLLYSINAYQWEWDIAAINAETNVSENAVSIVIERLRSLPVASRRAVMVASCLGSVFDKRLVLELLEAQVLGSLPEEDDSEPDFLLLTKNDVICNREGSETYRFSHDQIQLAARALFESQAHRERTHLAIGTFLLKPQPQRSNSYLVNDGLKQLLVTDQLNLGSSVLESDADRFMLMKNNHEAALVAIKKSAFVQAERFHKAAIALFPKEKLWSEYYELAVNINSSWVETLATLGEFEEVDRIVDEVLCYAKRPSDTCRVLYTKIDCFDATNRSNDGFVFGYSHLRKVRALKLSRRPGTFHALREFLRTKNLLKKMPLASLLQVKSCNREDKGYQRLLTKFADNAFIRDDTVAMLYLYLKVLNLAFGQGPSECTANSMVLFGGFLGATGDIKASHEVWHWVQAFADRFKSRSFYCRTFVAGYCWLAHLRQPVHELLDPMLQCYAKGMRAGDMMHACNAIAVYANVYFGCGLQLDPLIKDIRRYRTVFMEKNRCDSVRVVMEIIGQTALNFAGKARDPFQLDGEFFDCNKYRNTIVEANDGIGRLTYLCHWLQLCYILDSSCGLIADIFAILYKGKGERPKLVHDVAICFSPPHAMMLCLAAIALERKTGKGFYARKRKILTKVLKKFIANGVPAVSHRLLLVEAETMTLSSKVCSSDVKNAFEKAISMSSRTGFTKDAALANERCGQFFLQRQDQEWAEHYLTRAMVLYSDWGAHEKVMMMENQYPMVNSKSRTFAMWKSSGIRSRSRFNQADCEKHSAGIADLLFEDDNSSDGVQPRRDGD